MAATEILLLRHAERPGSFNSRIGLTSTGEEDAKSLTIRGWQRAGALAALLAPNRLSERRQPGHRQRAGLGKTHPLTRP